MCDSDLDMDGFPDVQLNCSDPNCARVGCRGGGHLLLQSQKPCMRGVERGLGTDKQSIICCHGNVRERTRKTR